MADYLSMDTAALQAEQQQLLAAYENYKQMNLKLDMSRGKPSAKQLDLSLGMMDEKAYKDNTGVDARNYGQLEGLPEARAFFAEMMGVTPKEVIAGGNSSLQLMYLAINLGWQNGFVDSAKPWSQCETVKFLCPVPGYDRHFRITETFGVEMINVPMTAGGPDMDVVEELVKDDSVKGIWCVPVYSNPDGCTYSAETVRRLAQMETGAADFRIMWDNAYMVHHLDDVHETCPNILDECRAAGHENRPLMFVSTSKITFAGAGVCAMAASEANIKDMLSYLMPMAISFDKVNQLRHVRYLQAEGGIAAHMQKHAALLRPKFEKVAEILHENLDDCGAIAHWTQPHGGYFIGFYALPGCAKRIVDLCKQAGVVLTGAGAAYPYGKDLEDTHIRIAPSFPPIEELVTAAQLLCIATRLASVEKLLQG